MKKYIKNLKGLIKLEMKNTILEINHTFDDTNSELTHQKIKVHQNVSTPN